jgi:hypothetical protein
MALTPAAMMNLRRGPTQGPTPNPGGSPPIPSAGLPTNPGADPGNLLMTAIAQRMSEAKKANANFAVSHLNQTKRVIGAMMIHLSQSHPDAARHLNRAWSSLDQAAKALAEAKAEGGEPVGPQLGFSGASIGPSQANPMRGNGGGGMGVPS